MTKNAFLWLWCPEKCPENSIFFCPENKNLVCPGLDHLKLHLRAVGFLDLIYVDLHAQRKTFGVAETGFFHGTHKSTVGTTSTSKSTGKAQASG